MGKIRNLDELEIYQEALICARDIYALTKKYPLSKDFSLRDQVRRASLSVAANIAEGFGRHTKKDFAHFLSIALGSANETIAFLDFIHLEYEIEVKDLKRDYTSLCKRIYSFRVYLSNKKTNN